MKRVFLFWVLVIFSLPAWADLLQNALGCADTRAAPSQKGGKVYLYPCHGKVRQNWHARAVNAHYFVMTTQDACLATDSGAVLVRPCRFDESDLWTFDHGLLRQSTQCLFGESIKKPLTLASCENKEAGVWRLLPLWQFWQHQRPLPPALAPGEVRENWGRAWH